METKFEFKPFEFQDELYTLIKLFESWESSIGLIKFKGSKAQKKNALKRLNTLKGLYREYHSERETAKMQFISSLKDKAVSLKAAASKIESTPFWWEIYSGDYPEKLRTEAIKLEKIIEFYSN